MLPPSVVAATFEELVGLVKACRKHNIIGKADAWQEFLEKHKQAHADPKKLPRDVLETYIEDLLLNTGLDDNVDGNAPTSTEEGAPPTAVSPVDFIERYLKWAKKIRKEAAAGRGLLPELPQSGVEAANSAATDPHQQQQQQMSVWSLVHRTRAHRKYGMHYDNLPSYSADWTRIKRPHLSADVQPRLLALDCEMCATDRDSSALLEVCVVDEIGEVVYRELVRPEGQIKDLRTAMTGISEADLADVKVTTKKARKAVRALLEGDGNDGRPAILVGHSLFHDLTALRLDYQPVIDTAFLFSYRGLPMCCPSLIELARQVLGMHIRQEAGGIHDAKEDAAVAMQLVKWELQRLAPTPPLEAPQIQVPVEQMAKLLVHSLPDGMERALVEQALRAMLAELRAPAFEHVEASDEHKKKLWLVFSKPQAANEAFNKLPGPLGKDLLGRHYKNVVVSVPGGTSLRCKVGKMACHNGMAFGSTGSSRQQQMPVKRGEGKFGGGGSNRAGGGAGASRSTEAVAAAARQSIVTADGVINVKKLTWQKRQEGDGGDPLKVAGKNRQVKGQPGTAAAMVTAIPAAAAANATETAPKQQVEAAGGTPQLPPGKSKKLRRKGGEEVQQRAQEAEARMRARTVTVEATTATAAAPASGTRPGGGNDAPTAADAMVEATIKSKSKQSGREGEKERKRKRERDVEVQEEAIGADEAKKLKEKTKKKTRKDKS